MNNILFEGTRFRDLLKADSSLISAAEQYFSSTFPADFEFKEIGPDFKYDPNSGLLYNGVGKVNVQDTKIKTITTFSENNEFGIRVLGLDNSEAVVIGEKEAGERLITFENGKFVLTDSQNKKQEFTFTGEELAKFNIKSDAIEIEGPVSGILTIDNEHQYARINNLGGKIIVSKNGKVKAENAVFETALIYLDGKFSYDKEKNIAEAFDHGDARNDGYTVIVDKGSRLGAKTQGQNSPSKLTVHFSGFAPYSAFAPADPNAKPPEDLKQVIEKVKNTRPPSPDLCTPSAGTSCQNAELYIDRDEFGRVIATAKGPVDVRFYDVAQGTGVTPSQTEPHFVGENGLSELDFSKGTMQTQINLRGKTTYTDNQYASYEGTGVKDGIRTREDGASVKIIRNEVNSEDVIYAECHQIGQGICQKGAAAVDISKTIALAIKVRTGIYTDPDYESVKISLGVSDDLGSLKYDWDEYKKDLGAIADKQTGGKEMVLGRTINLKSVVCEGNQECNLLLTQNKDGTAESFYELYDPQTKIVSERVGIKTNLGRSYGQATVLTSEKNIEKLQQMRDLMSRGAYSQIQQVFAKEPFEDDPELRNLVFKETGIDIDKLGSKDYMDRVGVIAKYHTEAKILINSLSENYGIKLDEFGQPLTLEDQQRLSEITSKKRSVQEGVIFDQYTKAKVALANAELQDKLAAHLACAGSSFCSVSDSDWKEAQKKLISEVKRREGSAEYKQWRDNVKLQEEAAKKTEEAANYLSAAINKYAAKISQTISGDLSTAEHLGEEYRKARNQQGKFQDSEESDKNAEETKKARLEAANSNLENAKDEFDKFKKDAEARVRARIEKSAGSKAIQAAPKEITIADWSDEDKNEYDLLRSDLASKEADVDALSQLYVNAPLNEKQALAGVQKLVESCGGNPFCEASIWNSAGFSRKVADTIITADLPATVKVSLTEDYGFSAQQEVFDDLDASSQKISDERKEIEELIKQGQAGKTGVIFADYVQYLSEDEQVDLAQSIDKGDRDKIVTALETVQQREQDSIASKVTALASGKDAIKVAKAIMQRTGNEAVGNSILKSLSSELRETAEFKEADHLAAAISEERLEEKRQERIASAMALQDKREGKDSGLFDSVTWENSGVFEYVGAKLLQGSGEALDYVGEGLYTGGRYISGYTSKGVGYAASAVGLEDFGKGAIKAGEIIITEKETEEQKLDRDIKFFTNQAEEFRQAQLFIAKQKAEGKTTAQALSALEGVTGDVSTSLAIKNIAKQGRRQLTVSERGEEAFAEAEIAEREHGQYMVDGRYQSVIDIAAGEDEELTRRALEKLGESNEIVGVAGVGLTQRDAAIVVPLAKQIVLSADNLIPGVLFVKAAEAGVKVARVIGDIPKINKAIDAVGDAAKLWKATEKTADLYRVSKTAVKEAEAAVKISRTAENVAKLERARESLKGAEAVLTVEKAGQQTRLGKVLGRKYYLGLTRKGDDFIAIEKAREGLTRDLALITTKLDDARRSSVAPETINLLEQSSAALIKKGDELDQAAEALHLAGSDVVTELRTPLKQRGFYKKQAQLATDFQKARESFLAERAAVGADKVRPETVTKLIETAKARESGSLTSAITSAIKGRLNAKRVEQNLGQLERAGIFVKFSDGKYVGEVAAGTPEARLLDSINGLVKDEEVLGRVVTGRIWEAPDLAPAEADRLGSLSDELSEVTDVKIDGPSTLHIDPDAVPSGWEGTPTEFSDKAREYNTLVAKANPEDIISEARAEVEAQISTLANDEQVAALATKDDLARRVGGEPSTGFTAQVVGKEALEMPKVRKAPDIETMGDVPTPTSVEAGQRSAALGSSDIGDISLAGESPKVLPLEKLPKSITTSEQNAQRVVGLLPEIGQDVKIETVAGNVFEGTLKYSDEEVLYLENFDEQQKILTSRVVDVEVPPKKVELEEVSLDGKVVNDNAIEPCTLAAAAIYGLAPCITAEAAELPAEISGEREIAEKAPFVSEEEPSSFIPEVSTVVERPAKLPSEEAALPYVLETVTEVSTEGSKAPRPGGILSEWRAQAKEALNSQKQGKIGEATLVFTKKIDDKVKVINGRLTFSYDGKNSFSIQIVDSETGVIVANHHYSIRGNDISIGFTNVNLDYQGLGMNQRMFQQMSDLHPEASTMDTLISGTNEELYREALEAGFSPSEAIKKTPAYKIRDKMGWDVKLEESTLPDLDELEDGKLILLISEKNPTVKCNIIIPSAIYGLGGGCLDSARGVLPSLLEEEVVPSPSLLDEVAEAEKVVSNVEDVPMVVKTDFFFETATRKTSDGRIIYGETVEGVQTVTYSGANRFDVEIINPKDNSRVASYSYVVNGNEFEVVDVFVPTRYQGAGVNTRLVDQTFDLHPEIKYTRGSLVGTNRDEYIKYLRDHPGANPIDAVKNTPAYKTRSRQGFELDVERSRLPPFEDVEKGVDITLVSRKKGTTVPPTSEVVTESILPTRATYRDGVFDLDGKSYRRAADGNWQQVVPDEERSLWQRMWGTNKNKEIPDEDYFDLSRELGAAEKNELLKVEVVAADSKVVDPDLVAANKAALGDFAGEDFVNNPEVKGILDEIDQGITCGTGGPSTGLAANCIPYLQNLNQRHKERVDRLNELLRKEGKPPIKATYKAPETRVNVPFVTDEVVSGTAEVPLTAATRKEGNVYTLDGVDYYDTVDGWKTDGLFGKKKVKTPSSIVDLNEGKHASIARGESLGVPEVGKPVSVEVKPIGVKGTLVRQDTEYIVIRDADGTEIKLKKTEVEPGSITGPGAAIDRHIQPGQEFSISSKNNVYSGKMIGREGDFLVVETQGERRLFGILPGKKERVKLRADAFNYNTQIPLGNEISIRTKSKRVSGVLAGDEASEIKIIDGGVEVPIRKGDLASDSVIVEGTNVDVIVNGDVTSGRYVSEGPTYVNLVDNQGRQVSVAKLGEDAKVVPSAGIFEAPTTSGEAKKIFQEVDLDKLSSKRKKEVVNEIYGVYNRKTISSSPVESGRFPVGIKTVPELSKEVGTDLIYVDQSWVRIFSKEDYPKENVVRFYFNSKDSESAKKVIAYVNDNLGKRNIPFEMKMSAEKAGFATRIDNTVLYFDGAKRKEVEEILAGLDGGLLDDEVPLFSKKIKKGISWAEDPNNGLLEAGMNPAEFKKKLEDYEKYDLLKSFGQARSEALAEIYSVTGGKIGPEFDDIAKEIFRNHGIDPDKPWLNLNSRLKEFPADSRVQEAGSLSDVVDPCNIAAAAIFGLAPCLGAVTEEAVEEISREAGKEVAIGAEVPEAEISGVRIKEPRFLESEPLLLERRVVETPAQISQEISVIKQNYVQQKIDLETIIQRHPSVKVQSADAAFTSKLGEGTVGIVYEADLLGVGDNLAFKTAKAVPLRGNLADNIDGLFGEFETAQEACKLVPCPQYYGIYKVDGVPYLVSDKVKGRHFFDLTDEEVIQYFTPEKISSFEQDLARAIDAGWNPQDLQAMVLTELHFINGKQYQAGDILFVDVADWSLDERITADVKQKFLDRWINKVINQPKLGAEQALAFRRDFAPAAEIIETASPEELKIALDAAGYDVTAEDVTAEVLAYLQPGDKQLRRMYELDIDPLLVSQKIPEAKAVRFKNNLPRAAEAVEDANTDELRRALDSAGYETTPDVLNIIKDRENRLRLMYMLDIDAEEVARAIPGTHFEQPFEIAGEKYFYDTRRGKWVREREEGFMKTLLGDKEVTDSLTINALDQARAKIGLPKAQPAVIQTGEDAFEIAGKEYYFENGIWKQKRALWFDKKLDEAEDSKILSRLDETRSKLIEEGLLPEAKLQPCSVVGGAIAGIQNCQSIILTSSIDRDRGLVRLTEDAASDQTIQRDLNKLANELMKGNFEAGLGAPGHVTGTDIFYLRSRNGARLYYRQI